MSESYISAILKALPDAQVDARLEGNHLHVTVVSAAFEGLSPVKKQQAVYSALNDYIASGEIHAVHMTTLTPSEHARAAQ